MHALVYTGTEKIVYREEKDPTKKPGEALVKVHASGICGSDKWRIRSRTLGSSNKKFRLVS